MNGRSVSRLVSVVCALALVTSIFFAGAGFALAVDKTRYEETDPSVTYTGVWNSYGAVGSGLSADYYKWLNSPGTATFTFTGIGVDWIALKQSYNGIAEARLDGGAWEQVILYSPTPLFQQVVWSKTGLLNGPHTVDVRWTGVHPLGPQPVYGGGLPPHNPAAIVDVDAFDVYTPSLVVGTPASSPSSLALLALGGLAVVGAAAIKKRVAA